MVANTYLEGTYSEFYPGIPQSEEGMKRLFRQFSFPGGIPSHDAPETPGSINEGGELGYAILHAYGAVFDNPDLFAVLRRRRWRSGDRTAARPVGTRTNSSTPRATARSCRSCISTATRSPAPPCSRAFLTQELKSLFEGYGYKCWFVEGDEPEAMHQKMAATMDEVVREITAIQKDARDQWLPRAPVVADDHSAFAEGLDRPQGA